MNTKEMFEESTTYIELSDGRVGFVDDVNEERFINDLKRLGLTYVVTTEANYIRYMILNKLSPEQVYRNVLGGKGNIE
jgi:hypothetical protein